MFPSLNKPAAFGATNPSTSFGGFQPTTSQNPPFGQTPQLFNKSSTPNFGTTPSLFGTSAQPSAASTSLFASASTPAFGSTASQAGFGSNSLFPTTTESTFGQNNTFGKPQNKSVFGFGAAGPSTIFGQTPSNAFQSGPTAADGVFGTGNSFGTTNQPGTVVKFVPVTGTDTMQKGGIAHSINTKHHCIVCMKEYENKSLEELRWEDYQCNRKGSQQQQQQPQQQGFNTPFASTTPSATTGGMFDNKPAFGQTGFGQSTGGGFGMINQTQPAMFGKTATTSAASTFGFGSTNTNAFATTSQPSKFTGTTNVFGSNTQATTPFTGMFTPQATQAFTFGTNNQTNAFQPPKTTAGFSMPFGQSTNTGFGQPGNVFGQQNPFGGFKSSTVSFGAPTTQPISFGLGSGFQPTNTNMFGSANKPGGGLFGTTTTNSFNFSMPNSSSQLGGGTGGFMMPNQQAAAPAYGLTNEQLEYINLVQNVYEPFPHNPLFRNLEVKERQTTTQFTNPKMLQELIDQATTSKYENESRLKVTPISHKPSLKFSVLDPDSELVTEVSDPLFRRRSTGKNLRLKKPTYSQTEETKDNMQKTSPLFKTFQSSMPLKAPTNIISPVSAVPSLKSCQTLSSVRLESKKTYMDAADTMTKTPQPSSSKKVRFKLGSIASEQTSEDDNNKVTVLFSRSKPFLSDSESDSPDSDEFLEAEEEIEPDKPNEPDEQNEPEKPASSSSPPPHGIKLTRSDYYTVPSMTKLAEHKSEDGTCLIKGFTVGRAGYGNVYFPDTIDVANLDLDSIVHFRDREIVVYPNDDEKPPLGEGLNRPAQVTLDNIWPRDANDKLIKDPNTLREIQFTLRLRIICESDGSHFVDYRPDTGSWVFKVDHFSKYGFSDEKDCEATLQIQKRMQENEKERLEKERLGVLDDMEMTDDFSLLPTTSEATTATSTTGLASIPRRSLGGIDMIELNDLPIEPLPDQMTKHTGQLLPSDFIGDQRHRLIQASYIFDEEVEMERSDEFVPLKQMSSKDVEEYMKPQKELEIDVRGVVDRIQPKVTVIKNKFRAPFSKLLASSSNYMDFAGFMGRSFKCGWLKPCMATLPGSSFSKNDTFYPPFSKIRIVDVATYPSKKDDPFGESLIDHLRVILEESRVSLDQNQIPTFAVNLGNGTITKHFAIAGNYASKYSTRSSYYRNIWHLCNILWGEESTDVDYTKYLFSEWLKKISILEVQKDLENVPGFLSTREYAIQKVRILLTGHQVKEACKISLAGKLPRLSLLLSQHGSDSARCILYKQIEEWYNYDILSLMEEDLIKIYLMLAGIADIPGHNIFQNLDWKRVFGAHFWYLAKCGCSIKEAVSLYEKTFKEGFSAAPHTWHNPSGEYDLIYQILCMYLYQVTSLADVLKPSTHTPDALDYRLSWLLFQTFKALGMGVMPVQSEEYLHICFANYLEQLGYWQWAIFALLFLKDQHLKKVEVTGVLGRNFTKMTYEIETQLVKDFKIPARWIHQNKLIEVKRNGRDNWSIFGHAMHAKDFITMHHVFNEKILPDLFIHGFFDEIKLFSNIVRTMSPTLHAGSFLELVVDTIAVYEMFTTLSPDNRLIDPFDVKKKLYAITVKVKYCEVANPKQLLTISEISKYLFSLLVMLIELFPQSHNENEMTANHMKDVLLKTDFHRDFPEYDFR